MSTVNSTANEEACYWVIKPERDTWIPEFSEMTVWLESIEGSALFLLTGTERANATLPVIENDEQFVVGAPIVFTTNDDIVVLLAKFDKDIISSFKLNAVINGRQYPFWEMPFIGKSEIYWQLFIIGIPSFIGFLILCCVCCCLRCCCAGTCCIKSCNYCNCCRCKRKFDKVANRETAIKIISHSKKDKDGPSSKPSKSNKVAIIGVSDIEMVPKLNEKDAINKKKAK